MSRIRGKLAIAGMLAGAAVGAMLVTAIPASAATAPCPANHYCFYSGGNYTGWHLNYKDTPSGQFNEPPYSDGSDRRDDLSSIINNSNRTICIYNDRFGKNEELIKVYPYQDVKQLAPEKDNKADYWKANSC